MFFVAIVSDIIIQFVHFLLKSLQVDFDLVDFLFEVFVALVKPYFLLLHDHLLVLKVDDSLVYFLKLIVLVDEDSLLFDPLAIELVAFLLEFFSFPE